MSEINIKKTTSYWDPLYDPADSIKYVISQWDFESTTGVRNGVLDGDGLKKYLEDKPSKHLKIRESHFIECLFRGNLEELTFSYCTFNKCDFGYSIWKKIKFSNCKFEKCSFTLSDFEDSQFVNCKWVDIGISGTSTNLKNTVITNPSEFIAAAWTNTNEHVLEQNNTTPTYQIMRLERTKATVAKNLLTNLTTLGSEISYYDAVKTYTQQNILAKQTNVRLQRNSRIKILFKKNPLNKRNIIKNIAHITWDSCKLLTLKLEENILNFMGYINEWGSNLGRVAVVGFALLIAFTAIYYFFNIKPDLYQSIVTSFDITFAAGYTNHATEKSLSLSKIIYMANLVFGLVWYSIFIPTVINKITKVR